MSLVMIRLSFMLSSAETLMKMKEVITEIRRIMADVGGVMIVVVFGLLRMLIDIYFN